MLNNLALRNKIILVVSLPLTVAAIVAVVVIGVATRRGVGAEEMGQVTLLVGIGAAMGVACAAVAAVVVGRDILRRLDLTATAAEELATVRLPALVDPESAPETATVPPPAPFETVHDDELGRVISSLNTVQATVVTVSAAQREAVRRGLSDLVVNLVRRNQSLLDRQVDCIDRMEAAEENPDRLEELYVVDHLATRMRRNADSLLVLADAESPRPRGESISVLDLMRVAMSEIEGYQSVHLGSVDDAEVSAQTAFDLAHLASELLENATHFSPPDSRVELTGSLQDDGSYLVSIADSGIGMDPDEIAATNDLLADPPSLDIGMSRSLGLTVVGRLAKRIDATVELRPTTGETGITAEVLVPETALAGNEPDAEADGDPGPDSEHHPDHWETDGPRSTEPLPSTRRSNALSNSAPSNSAAGDVDGRDSNSDQNGRDVDSGITIRDVAPVGSPESDRDAASPDEPAPAPEPGFSLDGLPAGSGWAPPESPERGAHDLARRDNTASSPSDSDAPAKLEDAVPSGDAFEAGVAKLVALAQSPQRSSRSGDDADGEIDEVDGGAEPPHADDPSAGSSGAAS